jgi:hypothetical protein
LLLETSQETLVTEWRGFVIKDNWKYYYIWCSGKSWVELEDANKRQIAQENKTLKKQLDSRKKAGKKTAQQFRTSEAQPLESKAQQSFLAWKIQVSQLESSNGDKKKQDSVEIWRLPRTTNPKKSLKMRNEKNLRDPLPVKYEQQHYLNMDKFM